MLHKNPLYVLMFDYLFVFIFYLKLFIRFLFKCLISSGFLDEYVLNRVSIFKHLREIGLGEFSRSKDTLRFSRYGNGRFLGTYVSPT